MKEKTDQDRLGSGTMEVSGITQVRDHAWFRSIDWDALYRKEIQPPYVPSCEDPLAHFPKHLVNEVVRDADYKAPRARKAALRRTGSGKDPFADFHFERVYEPEPGAELGLLLEEGEEEEQGSLEEPVALQMQWEFESGGDGWEAFGVKDQQALALAYSTGQKEMMLYGETGQRQHSYRLDLQRMVQMNMDSGRERKLRRLPAGRLHSGLDAVRMSEGIPNRPGRSQSAAADSRLGVVSAHAICCCASDS